MAARAGPPDPTAEEKLPHPIIQSVPKLHKTIRHPVKPVYPASIGPPPPCGGTDASKTSTPEPGPSACTNPCSRRHTNQDPSPPGPAVTPTRRQSAPRSPNPPPDQPRTVRPPGWQPTSAGTGIPAAPHAAARETASKSHNTPSRPRPQPSAEPPKKPTPREPPDAPGPYCTPRQQQKPQPDRIGTPTTLGDGADQRSPERLI